MSHTFLFADLCGFTEYTFRHGDGVGAHLAVTFQKVARELAAEEGCDVIKSIGDAVMVHAENCCAALRLARRLIALSEREGFPPIRAGVDTGPAIEHNGDWYGSTVNTAARVTDVAAPGELLVTERARAATAGQSGVRLDPRGLSHLRGLPDLEVHALAAARALSAVTERPRVLA
jgi:adenylate cyclase